MFKHTEWNDCLFPDATCCLTLGGYHQNHTSASKRKHQSKQEITLYFKPDQINSKDIQKT